MKKICRVIKMIIFDIDGILTDGKVYIDEYGKEIKSYSLVDTDYINILKKEGYILCAITGEDTQICSFFEKRYPWDDFIFGCKEKGECLEDLARKYSVDLSEIAYIGDGVYDISALKKAGISFCPSNSPNEVKRCCDVVLNNNGGCGVVAELYSYFCKEYNNDISPIVKRHLDNFIKRYSHISNVECLTDDIVRCYQLMESCYLSGGKVLIAGNGGSAADSEHMVGELMKSFRVRRPIDVDLKNRLVIVDEKVGIELATKLETPLRAISLMGNDALSTAISNDIDGKIAVAQKLLGLGTSKDILFGISTSGNSENILNAFVLAKAMNIKTIALTGKGGGRLAELADVSIIVQENETHIIQELQLPIYHCLCLMLEERFFGTGDMDK